MRIVTDTNVLVSSILSPAGNPAQVLNLILSRRVVLLVSHPILSEYEEVLNRKEFSFPQKTVQELLHFIKTYAEAVIPAPLRIPLPDPDDLPFLACALDGKADFLITGNKRHFPPSLCRPIVPLSSTEFLEVLKDIPR